MFHLEKVLLMYDSSKITNREKYIKVLMSSLFLNKMDLLAGKRFKCQINKFTAWPLPLVPPELFVENIIPVEIRKLAFYKCLQIGHCLDCRVSSTLSTEYELKVINKYGVTRIVDDLNILVTMQKGDNNEPLNEFQLNDVIRVVVSEIKEDELETKVFVSVNDNNIDPELLRPQLGRIPETQVPMYVLPPHWDKTSSYKDYLTGSAGFYDPVLLNGIYEGFGIDPRGTYSCFPANESINVVDANALLKEVKSKDIHDFIQIALSKLAEENFSSALTAIELAIKIFPIVVTEKDKEELSKLYEIKATIEIAKDKPLFSRKGYTDLVTALNLDLKNESLKGDLSKEMFKIANKCYKLKIYHKAAEYATQSLKLNQNNEANALMEYLKKKYPEATVDCVDCDDESLLALLEKRKALGSELEKLSGERIVI